jgi:hypothetical protein
MHEHYKKKVIVLIDDYDKNNNQNFSISFDHSSQHLIFKKGLDMIQDMVDKLCRLDFKPEKVVITGQQDSPLCFI